MPVATYVPSDSTCAKFPPDADDPSAGENVTVESGSGCPCAVTRPRIVKPSANDSSTGGADPLITCTLLRGVRRTCAPLRADASTLNVPSGIPCKTKFNVEASARNGAQV